MIKTFYVRPDCASGYGKGDGTSYENAWNGFRSVDWNALAGQPATLWVCGDPGGPGGFVTLHVEWSYLNNPNKAHEITARPHTRRESAVAV
jgi:hypothetical protein